MSDMTKWWSSCIREANDRVCAAELVAWEQIERLRAEGKKHEQTMDLALAERDKLRARIEELEERLKPKEYVCHVDRFGDPVDERGNLIK